VHPSTPDTSERREPRRAPLREHQDEWTVSRPQQVLRAVAIAACLPYLVLKAGWVLGSEVGIPRGSSLLDGGATLRVVNTVGVLMDLGVVVLALLLTCLWGRRVPGWLLVGPVWLATGLLTPIVLAYPVQLVLRATSGSPNEGPAAGEPFLAEWVFSVVYSGFIAQGLSLGALFVLYARRRWGHRWVGTVDDLGASRVPRAGASVVLAALATGLMLMHLVWALGGTTGLTVRRAVERTQDFHALEGAYVALALATVGGLLSWTFGWPGRLPLWIGAGLAVVGSAGLAGWGAWLLVVQAVNTVAAHQATALMTLVHVAQVVLGAGVLAVASRCSRAAPARVAATASGPEARP
jgi:hypothetical protein